MMFHICEPLGDGLLSSRTEKADLTFDVLKRHAMRLITVYKKQVNKINSIGSEMAVQNLKLRNVILPLRIVQGLN